MKEAVHQTDSNQVRYRHLYEANYQKVLAYCIRRVGQSEARDLAAEVFTVAWRKFDAIPPGPDALRWLYGVAFRVVSGHRRGRGLRRRLEARARATLPAEEPGPELRAVQKHEHDLVIKAASFLRHLDREVLYLAVWEELSHAEIAEILGLSIPAVRQRWHRTKRVLAKQFVRLGGTVPTSPTPGDRGGEA